nr:hypothetical protein CFP56_00648 [Quercus suber]
MGWVRSGASHRTAGFVANDDGCLAKKSGLRHPSQAPTTAMPAGSKTHVLWRPCTTVRYEPCCSQGMPATVHGSSISTFCPTRGEQEIRQKPHNKQAIGPGQRQLRCLALVTQAERLVVSDDRWMSESSLDYLCVSDGRFAHRRRAVEAGTLTLQPLPSKYHDKQSSCKIRPECPSAGGDGRTDLRAVEKCYRDRLVLRCTYSTITCRPSLANGDELSTSLLRCSTSGPSASAGLVLAGCLCWAQPRILIKQNSSRQYLPRPGPPRPCHLSRERPR